MRTTLEIILAVKDQQPVTEEELRLSLLAMNSIKYFLSDNLQKLVECIRQDRPMHLTKMQAEFAWGTISRMFDAMKTPPDKWLGRSNIPGTIQYAEQQLKARMLFKKMTGTDL